MWIRQAIPGGGAKSYGDVFNPLGGAESQAGATCRKSSSVCRATISATWSAVLRSAFAGSATPKDIEFRLTPQYLMLTLPVTDLFMPGSGGFAESAKTPVFDLSGVLSNLKNRIAVVGTAADVARRERRRGALAHRRARAMAEHALVAAGYASAVAIFGRGGAMRPTSPPPILAASRS